MITEREMKILKNGIECEIRSPLEEDAEELIHLVQRTSEESKFLLMSDEEVQLTIEKELSIIRNMRDAQRGCMLVALINGEIVGIASVDPVGSRNKMRHRCTIGIALLEKVWNIGLGSAMIQSLMKIAVQLGYTQMELGVFANNTRAIHLYEKLGFECTGKIVDAFVLKDGSRINEKLMQRKLSEF